MVVEMVSFPSAMSNKKFSMIGNTERLGITPEILLNCFNNPEDETMKFIS